MPQMNNIIIKESAYQLLQDQLRRGFEPKWFISFHYTEPSDSLTPQQEGNSNRVGFRDSDRGLLDPEVNFNLWNRSGAYVAKERVRNTRDWVEHNTRDIKNKILKRLFNIKRLDKWREHTYPPMLFFHERGKSKVKYHTHLVLPQTKLRSELFESNSTDYLKKVLEGNVPNGIKDRCKSISIDKSIDVLPVYNSSTLFSYLNKETTEEELPLDTINSLMYTPNKDGGYKITSGAKEQNHKKARRL